MGKPLRVLVIEDVEDHALLLVRELEKGGYDASFQRVETVQELETALENGGWDAIISDFSLPGLDGFEALRRVQAKGLDVPFILVSGAIGEEKAAEIMKAGAQAYIRKGNYARLTPTLERELREADVRAERRRSAQTLTQDRLHLEEQVRQQRAEVAQLKERLETEIERRRVLEGKLKECEAGPTGKEREARGETPQ